MRKIFFGIVSAFALLLVASPVFASNPMDFSTHISGAEDIGTCNNVWAHDDYDKNFFFTDNGNGTYDVKITYTNGTFMTVGGKSPGACESGTDNGYTVPAGINGTIVDEVWTTTITGTPSGAFCGSSCTSASISFGTLFNSGYSTSSWSEYGHYATDHNGSWYDTLTNWPLKDTGDITGNTVYAKITSPSSGTNVSGTVEFKAYLSDTDVDPIQWAVREGTCDAGTNTVFGNVDGHNDVASIDPSDLTNQTFSFSGKMSGMTPGMYCFIYNPKENKGESNMRETVQFNLVGNPDQVTGMTIYQNNQEIGCGATTDQRDITVKWNAITDPFFAYYQYQADADQSSPFDFTTNVLTNDRSGTIRDQDGTYSYRVRGVDTFGNQGDWSDWCSITLDRSVKSISPENKNQCKKDGWKSFNAPTFKNQGDCVSYVQSNSHALGNKNK